MVINCHFNNFGRFQKVRNCSFYQFWRLSSLIFWEFQTWKCKNFWIFKLQSCCNGQNGSFWAFEMTKIDFSQNLMCWKIMNFTYRVFSNRLSRSVSCLQKWALTVIIFFLFPDVLFSLQWSKLRSKTFSKQNQHPSLQRSTIFVLAAFCKAGFCLTFLFLSF